MTMDGLRRTLAAATAALAVTVVGAQPTSAEFAAEGAKTVELTQQLIRFDTYNAPGDTTKLAEFLKSKFEPLGAQVDIVVAPNGKAAHFFARIKGDGSKPPVLLAAHADVVPVEKEKWTVDPLAGVVKDGFVYGRGAMDFKGGIAVFARAVMRLAENKVPLARDVIFLAEADEEQGQYNTSWLAREHWDKMKAEFALNEGGYVLQDKAGTVRQVNVTTVEKLSVTFRLKTKGPVGHSSRPLPPMQTANGRMIAALARLSAYDTSVKLVPEARSYFGALAKLNPGPLRRGIESLLRASDSRAAANAERDVLAAKPQDAPMLHALMRDTFIITMFNSGIKPNVIPGEAEAIVNTRLLPGTTTDQLVAEMKKVLADPDLTIEIVSPLNQAAARDYYLMRTQVPASPITTDLYRAIERNAKTLWPQAEVIPALFEAGTDATAWRERGVPVYGIYPYPLNDEILLTMHGHDERIAVRSLHEGTEFVYRILLDVAKR
jgi:acetylornithine deacetylase/succinyl-diaminopimelate desuccinylase-like protein